MKFRIFAIILVILIIIIAFMFKIIGTNHPVANLMRTYIPNFIIEPVKETIFVFKQNKILEDKIIYLNKKITDKENTIKKINHLFPDLPNLLGFIPISKVKDITYFEFDNFKYKLEKFNTGLLLTSKHRGSIGNSYIDFKNENLFMTTANGIFSYTNFKNFEKENFKFQVIKSNIKEIIKYEDFYSISSYGIKDMLIHKNYLYVSYSNEYKKDCFNTGILRAKLNTDFLNFYKFFNPQTCIMKLNDYGEFNAHHSGGRIINYKDDKLLFSTGEYRYRTHAQNKNNLLGKIISIDLKNKQTKILSIGHRNPQGLFYDKEMNYIISTEHGPKGGDEINLNDLNKVEIKNFGWPISSYGVHYIPSKKKLESAPLHKSHKKFGFKEPLKYFTPSIGISEIIKISSEFNNIQKTQYFFGALGKSFQDHGYEGHQSLHQVIYDEDFELIKHNIFNLEERVRDLLYSKSKRKLFLYLESTASIGVLSLVSHN